MPDYKTFVQQILVFRKLLRLSTKVLNSQDKTSDNKQS